MRTLKINSKRPQKKMIALAAEEIKRGKIVAFPTETVYGIGCSPFIKSAVRKIFALKGRAANKPVAILVSNMGQARSAAKTFSKKALAMAKEHWPGPLTLVVKKSRSIPNYVTGGKRSIGIRMPDHKAALELINTCGFPIAATSANISGKPPAKSAADVKKQLKGLDLLLDGGRCRLRTASTVVDLSGRKPRLLRAGSMKIRI